MPNLPVVDVTNDATRMGVPVTIAIYGVPIGPANGGLGLPVKLVGSGGMPIIDAGGALTAWLPVGPSNTLPSVAMDFQNGRYWLGSGSSSLAALTATTRASTATYYDASGVLQTAAVDTARIGSVMAGGAVGLISEQARTNSTRNSTWAGAVAGAPGTAPTGQTWQTGVSGSLGLTREIVSVRTENGITWLRIKYSGVTSGATLSTLAFLYSSTDTAAVNGQTWSANLRVALVDGSFAGLTTLAHRLRFNDAGGGTLTSVDASLLGATSTPANYDLNLTASNASTAYVGQALLIGAPLSTTINFTVDLGVPQLELGLNSTSFIPTSGAAVTRAADVVKWSAAAMALFSSTAGTFLIRGQWRGTGTPTTTALFVGENGANRMQITTTSGNTIQVFGQSTGGANQITCNLSSIGTANSPFSIAFAYATNDVAASSLGAAAVADATADLPAAIDRIYIGAGVGGAAQCQTPIAGLYYWPTRQINSDLVALSGASW